MTDKILAVACLIGMIGWGAAYFVFFRKIARTNVLLSALLAVIAFSITVWLLFIPMADWDFAVSRNKRPHNIPLFSFLSVTEFLFPWLALWFLYQHKNLNPTKR